MKPDRGGPRLATCRMPAVNDDDACLLGACPATVWIEPIGAPRAVVMLLHGLDMAPAQMKPLLGDGGTRTNLPPLTCVSSQQVAGLCPAGLAGANIP